MHAMHHVYNYNIIIIHISCNKIQDKTQFSNFKDTNCKKIQTPTHIDIFQIPGLLCLTFPLGAVGKVRNRAWVSFSLIMKNLNFILDLLRFQTLATIF